MSEQAQTPAPLPPQNNMPPAVRRQVDDANRLIAELNAKPGEIPAGTEVQMMPGTETPGSMPTGQRQQWKPATPSAPAAQPAAQQPTRQPAPPSAAAAAADSDEKWEQRYRSLQGKYDAEMRMTREIMQQQQQTMDKLIERQQSAVATPPAKEQTPEEYLRSLGVTDKELADYGEVLPIMAKMAQNMIEPTAAKLERELQKTKEAAGTVASAQIRSARTAMFAALDAAVPDWRVINEDENFLAWLDHVDIIYGTSRRDILATAYKNLDATRVVAIFSTFVQEDSARRSTSGPSVDRETLIAPGVPRGGAAEAPGGADGKRILSEQEVADFYSRVRRRLVKPDEYARISAEIAKAASEGRIKPNRPNHHSN